jgi:hypothetical protein
MKQRDLAMAWEELVTAGHVRAARFRHLQPWLFGLGLALIFLGYALMSLVHPPAAGSRAAETLSAEVERLTRPSQAAFVLMPQPVLKAGELPKLPSAEDVKRVHDLITTELDHNDKLPTFRRVDVDATAFWRGAWPHDRYIVTERSKLKLVGVIFNAGAPDFPQPYRWLSVYRKTDGAWQNVAIEGGDFVAMRGQTSASPRSIARTLAPLTKIQESRR